MTRKIRWVMSSVILPLLQLGCASSYKIEKDLVFKSVDGVNLVGDLYSPKKAGIKPAVLVVHGGGWRNRTGDMKSLCGQLAEAGFVAFNTTYRLAPENHFPKAVDDVRDAALWMRAHAEKFEINPDQIAGWGYSAGSNLIMLAGLDGGLGLSSIIAGGTPADLTVWPGSPMVLDFIGSTKEESPDTWKDASPINHVTDKTPPVFMYHGAWDDIVEIDQMERMAEALRAKGRVVETHTVAHAGHIIVYLFSQESVDLGMQFIRKNLR